MIREDGLNHATSVSEGGCFAWSLTSELRCPCCGSAFKIGFDLRSSRDGLKDGVLQCDCYEYPVVSGIPVLRQMGPVSSTRNDAVECLKRRDRKSALQWLFKNGTAMGVPGLEAMSDPEGGTGRLVRQLRKLIPKTPPRLHNNPEHFEGDFQATLQAARPRGYADYLFHRLANPSLLGAIPPLVVFGDACRKKSTGRVLDLLCGTGHASAILKALRPEVQIVMADSDFVNLFLARQFVVPRSAALCVDAELPLPFGDASFDGLFCLDGLHYVRSKVALLREMDRIVSTDGFWLLPHMHNVTGENGNPGAPLSAEGYAMRFNFGRQRLIPEQEVLRQFQSNGSLDMTAQSDVRSMFSSNALTLVGARTENLWEMHAGLDDAMCRRPDLLGFNPLYHVEEVSDGLMLRTVWPSEELRQECIGVTPVLPEAVHIPRCAVNEIVELRSTGTLSDDVRKLVRSFVLVCLPECYPRTGFTA